MALEIQHAVGQNPGMCMECGSEFEIGRAGKRFCGDLCKDKFHNREKKEGAIRLTPNLRAQLRELAAAHNVPLNEMACRIFQQAMHPDGQPLNDDEIFGKKEG